MVCEKCGAEFIFRVEEQRREQAQGQTSEPKRCASCRREPDNGQRCSGVAEWFSQAKGYGFIERDG
jgi:hypothetical protein